MRPFICPKRVPKRHLTRDIINMGSRPVANGPYALSDGYPVGRSETTLDFVHTFQTPKKSEVQKKSPSQSRCPTPSTALRAPSTRSGGMGTHGIIANSPEKNPTQSYGVWKVWNWGSGAAP